MINKIIFKYLDKQNFILIDNTKKIYFVNSESDEYSKISYNKNNGWCIIYHELIEEISAFFSIKESDSEKVISMWVENVLQMRVADAPKYLNHGTLWVENTPQMRVTDTTCDIHSEKIFVENTLQMKVTDTLYNGTRHHRQLRIPVQMRVTDANLVNS